MSTPRSKSKPDATPKKASPRDAAGMVELLGLTPDEVRALGPEKFEKLLAAAFERDRQRRHAEIDAKLAAAERMIEAGNLSNAMAMLRREMHELQDEAFRQSAIAKKFARMFFGPRSEKLDADELHQLALAFGVTEEEYNAAVRAGIVPAIPIAEPPVESSEAAPNDEDREGAGPAKNANHRGRRPLVLAPSVHVHETVRNVEGDERICIQCGAEKTCIHYVRHERIEIVPASLVLHVELREVAACGDCRADAVTAERTEPNLTRRRVGTSISADLIAEKCSEAQPIYRQKARYERLGWTVSDSTIEDAYRWGTDLLSPIADVVRGEVLREAYVQADSTPLLLVDPTLPLGKTKGQVWTFVSTSGVAFDFTPSWSAQDIAPSFAVNWDGYKQVDDYAGYGSLVTHDGFKRQLVPDTLRLGCMMHVRRRFHEAFKQKDARAAVPLELIRRLYKIEEHARSFDADARLRHRNEHSQPVLAKLWEWIGAREGAEPPKTLLGGAIRYALDQREYVDRCFTRGEFEIDNGAPEREIKAIAIGRKNFLFTGSVDAAERLAAAYTLVANAKRLKLDPFVYLRDTLDRLERGFPISRVSELTPRAYAAAKTAE